MYLYEIAHGRTGDKGDISNISVIAYDKKHWQQIKDTVTADKVLQQLCLPKHLHVDCYVLDNLCALNFVIYGGLWGGVTQSLALDTHGKCLASVVLMMEI